MNDLDECLADLDRALNLIDRAAAALVRAGCYAQEARQVPIAGDLAVLANALRCEGDAALDVFLRAINCPSPRRGEQPERRHGSSHPGAGDR